MTKTIFFALLAVTLAPAIAFASYHGIADVRARRRARWELERAEWRRWISRP